MLSDPIGYGYGDVQEGSRFWAVISSPLTQELAGYALLCSLWGFMGVHPNALLAGGQSVPAALQPCYAWAQAHERADAGDMTLRECAAVLDKQRDPQTGSMAALAGQASAVSQPAPNHLAGN